MEPMSISEFARLSRLSQKALRPYDEKGLLPPARVDELTGYRYYESDQTETARLIAGLRQLGVPLAEIQSVLDLDPSSAADRIADYWSGVEAEHAARQDLADLIVKRLTGSRCAMYEAETREVPSYSLLCLKRNVDGSAGAWALGKEFVELLKEHRLPLMEGRVGATFCIHWGEVSDDSDGPLEWCRSPHRSTPLRSFITPVGAVTPVGVVIPVGTGPCRGWETGGAVRRIRGGRR